MIPNFNMGYYHHKDYIRPCQMSDKIKKPLGFEYTSLISTRTYSILSYIVGGFVGSKSQMNNDKHLSYDLSSVIFNLLNPQKKANRPTEKSYCSKLNYDKYYQKSNYKEQTIDLELDLIGALSLFDQNVFSFNGYCDKINKNQRKSNGSDKEIDSDRIIQKTVHMDSVAKRSRQQSESSIESTDSESFIVFDEQDDEKKEKKVGTSFECDYDDLEEEDYDDEDDDEDDDDYSDDDGDYVDDDEQENVNSVDKELAQANKKWSKSYQDITDEDKPPKKVTFSSNVKINRIVAWDYAYRAARLGPWEQMARDRVRFRERILRLSSIICPVLAKDHREKIYNEIYS